MESKEILHNIIEYLYHADGNISFIGDIKSIEGVDIKEINRVISTPTLNKGLIKGRDPHTWWFIRVELNTKGAKYFENNYSFDKDINLKNEPIINIHNINNSWNIALENNWEQLINISNNDIEQIFKLLDTKSFSKKDTDELKRLLKEYSDTQDKSKLVDFISVLWGLASTGSFISGIITILTE